MGSLDDFFKMIYFIFEVINALDFTVNHSHVKKDQCGRIVTTKNARRSKSSPGQKRNLTSGCGNLHKLPYTSLQRRDSLSICIIEVRGGQPT